MGAQKFAAEIGVAHTTQQAKLGELHADELGNHYRYMQADGAVTANLHYTYTQTFQIDEALTTTVAASGESHPLCISPVTLADNEWAWVFVGPGTVTATSAGAITAEAKLFTTATAGKIDDNSSGTVLLPGQVATTAFASAVTGTIYAAIPMYVSN